MSRSKTAVKKCSLDTIGNSRRLEIKKPKEKEVNKSKERYEKKRAAKALTKAAMYKCFGLKSEINEDYRQAYMCNEYIFQNGSRVTSNYCTKKCCTVCNRINSAKKLLKYGPRILGMDNLYLVTLTDKNVFKGKLQNNVREMFNALTKIKQNMRKTYSKSINGYRTFECTYSFKNGFNPHFHFIVEGEDVANLLVELWLKQFPTADIGGQDIRKVDKSKKSLLEVFKYIAKPVTKGYYNAKAYDEIMRTAKKHRVTDALGSIRGLGDIDEKVDGLDIEGIQSQTITFKEEQIQVWKYVEDLYDYVAPDGELFLGTKMERKTSNAIKIINESKSYNKENEIKERPQDDIFKRHREASRDVIF